jgi:hypothetical protein
MNKPDEQTYRYTTRDSTGRVISKGSMADGSKWEANQAVKKLKARLNK